MFDEQVTESARRRNQARTLAYEMTPWPKAEIELFAREADLGLSELDYPDFICRVATALDKHSSNLRMAILFCGGEWRL